MELAISIFAILLATVGGFIMGYDRGQKKARSGLETTIDKHVLDFGNMISMALQSAGIGRLDCYKTEAGMGAMFLSADDIEAMH